MKALIKVNDAGRVFGQYYNNFRNFVTPDIVDRYFDGDLVIELSSGKNLEGDGRIYGVTVLKVERSDDRYMWVSELTEHCKCLMTVKEAREHIKTITTGFASQTHHAWRVHEWQDGSEKGATIYFYRFQNGKYFPVSSHDVSRERAHRFEMRAIRNNILKIKNH